MTALVHIVPRDSEHRLLHWLDPLLACDSPQTLQGPLAQTREAKGTLPFQPAQERLF